MLLFCVNVLSGVADSLDMLIVVFLVVPGFGDVVSIADDAKDNCCVLFVVPAVVELVGVWLGTDVDFLLEETPCVAEVYVGCALLIVEGDSDIVLVEGVSDMLNVMVDCALLVVEGDSDIVLVSDADKLLNVLVAVSPLVGGKKLERVELVDVAADAVDVEGFGTLD